MKRHEYIFIGISILGTICALLSWFYLLDGLWNIVIAGKK